MKSFSTVRRISGVSVFALLLPLSVGCGANDGGDYDLADGRGQMDEAESAPDESGFTKGEKQTIEDVLAVQGFDTNTLVFLSDGRIVVEGDIGMDGRALLEWASTPVEKGYWGGEGFVNRDVWIKNSSTQPVSNAWALAFANAATNWNDKTNVNFQFSTPSPSQQTITIRKASLGAGTQCVWAQGTFPIPVAGTPFARVGTTVTLNSAYNCPQSPCGGSSIDTIPLEQAIKVAAHELGHNLGFRHPGSSGGGTKLPGTADASTNYKSVMWQGCVGGKVVARLSADDVLSAGILFPNL